MDGRSLLVVHRVPHTVHNVTVAQLVKNTVTSKNYEIVLLLQLKALDVWHSNHYVWVSSKLLALSFDVTESPRDRESPWKHAVRAQYIIAFDTSTTKSWHLCDCLCLVDFSSVLDDPLLLNLISWAVVA